MQRSASMLQVKERHGSDGSCCRHVFFFPASLERVWNAYVQTRRRLCGVSRKTATKGVRTTIVQTLHRQPPCNPRTMHRRRQRGHDLEQDRAVSDVRVSDEDALPLLCTTTHASTKTMQERVLTVSRVSLQLSLFFLLSCRFAHLCSCIFLVCYSADVSCWRVRVRVTGLHTSPHVASQKNLQQDRSVSFPQSLNIFNFL